MLYTVVPIEDVMAPAWRPPAGGEAALSGRQLLYEWDPAGTPRLVRLVSTDPLDYLDPRLQPGADLSWAVPRQVVC